MYLSSIKGLEIFPAGAVAYQTTGLLGKFGLCKFVKENICVCVIDILEDSWLHVNFL